MQCYHTSVCATASIRSDAILWCTRYQALGMLYGVSLRDMFGFALPPSGNVIVDRARRVF